MSFLPIFQKKLQKNKNNKETNQITPVVMQCTEMPMQSYITNYMIIQPKQNTTFAAFKFILSEGDQSQY